MLQAEEAGGVLRGLAILAVRGFLLPCPSHISLIAELVSCLGADTEVLSVHGEAVHSKLGHCSC